MVTIAAGAAACATTAAPPVVSPAPAAPASAPTSAPANPTVDALLAVIQARHGDRLSAAQVAGLRKTVGEIAGMAATLRATRLPNDAEPSGGLIGNPGRVA